MNYQANHEREPLHEQPYNPNNANQYYPQSAPAQPQPQAAQPYNYDKVYEEDEQKEYMTEIRRGFVQKVYGILSATLLFTALICVGPTVDKGVQRFLADNLWILITFAILAFVPLYALFCFRNVARKVPINYILLFSFVF